MPRNSCVRSIGLHLEVGSLSRCVGLQEVIRVGPNLVGGRARKERVRPRGGGQWGSRPVASAGQGEALGGIEPADAVILDCQLVF